jgi:hypothetical protein
MLGALGVGPKRLDSGPCGGNENKKMNAWAARGFGPK